MDIDDESTLSSPWTNDHAQTTTFNGLSTANVRTANDESDDDATWRYGRNGLDGCANA